MKKEKTKLLILLAVFVVSVVLGFVIISHIPYSESSDELFNNRSHVYWKTVSCKVDEIRSGLTLNIHVVNDKYKVDRTFIFWGKEADKYRDVKVGDMMKCTMYSWVNEGTGEVENRSLDLEGGT